MKYTTNLFPRKDETPLEKITYFALHYLRYILVITQFVTICVFFYRFKVDQEIVNLKDTLTQKKAIVDTTHNLLDLVKELDLKIKNINTLYAKQDAITDISGYFFQKIPPQISVTSLTIGEKDIIVSGKTSDIASIQNLYESIKSDKAFKEVNLGSIDKIDAEYNFTMDLKTFVVKNGP